jgi:Ca-activated chloride channel family protein
MKRFPMLCASVLIGGVCATSMSLPGRPGVLRLEGRMNCPVLPEEGGRAYLQILLSATGPASLDRRPVNLSVVLDRSGSMGEEGKMQNAKAALRALINGLSRDDIFSLVIYDDVVDVLRDAGRAGEGQELIDLVEGIQPRGWTNLGGGMLEGFSQAERYAGRKYVNRVVLISDGLANRGITDPRELGRFVRGFRKRSISLTTMGVGLDYNENLMTSLAAQGGGNYYFIESPRNLASVLRDEFAMLGCVVAQNAVIELSLSTGVNVVDVIGTEFTARDGRLRIPVGDFCAGERREFTVELDIPPGKGRRLIARGDVSFGPVRESVSISPLEGVTVRYSEDPAEVNRNRDLGAQASADVAVSTRGVDRAMDALDLGRNEEALKEIAAARRQLQASPAASGSPAAEAIREQDERLSTFEQRLKDGPASLQRAKKSIQYDNYRTLRGKQK